MKNFNRITVAMMGLALISTRAMAQDIVLDGESSLTATNTSSVTPSAAIEAPANDDSAPIILLDDIGVVESVPEKAEQKVEPRFEQDEKQVVVTVAAAKAPGDNRIRQIVRGGIAGAPFVGMSGRVGGEVSQIPVGEMTGSVGGDLYFLSSEGTSIVPRFELMGRLKLGKIAQDALEEGDEVRVEKDMDANLNPFDREKLSLRLKLERDQAVSLNFAAAAQILSDFVTIEGKFKDGNRYSVRVTAGFEGGVTSSIRSAAPLFDVFGELAGSFCIPIDSKQDSFVCGTGDIMMALGSRFGTGARLGGVWKKTFDDNPGVTSVYVKGEIGYRQQIAAGATHDEDRVLAATGDMSVGVAF